MQRYRLMTRCLVLAIAGACGTQPRVPQLPAPKPVTRASAAPALPAPPLVRTDAGRGGAEAPPAAAIAHVAVTPDGTAAATADENGDVRLWPALDGTRQPRVVIAPQAHALAIGPRADGFTIAVLDAAGGLYLANVDRDGHSRSHVSLAGDAAYVGIAMTSAGLLAWRADESIALLDGDGATLAQVATEPGERIVTIAVSGGHAAALLARENKRGVRGLALAGGMRWNDWIALGDSVGDTLAVSPSGTRLAVVEGEQLAVLDGAGRLIEHGNRFATDVFAFTEDDTLVFATRSGLAWHFVGRSLTLGPHDVTGPLLAVGGDRAVSASNGELVLASSKKASQYLGYGMVAPTIAQPAIDGQLVIGLGATFLTLDKSLAEAGTPTFPVPPNTQVADMRWLGGDAWVVEAADPDDGVTSLVVVGGGKSKVVRSGLVFTHVLMYEPSTHLLTLSLGDAPSVYRFDPATLELALLTSVKGEPYTQTELVPVAPARAGGAQLLYASLRDETTVEWLRDPAKLRDVALASAKFQGAIAATDAAGHVYGWQSTASGMELAVLAAGKRIGKLPAEGPVSLWPAPAGDEVIEISAHVVTLLALDGKQRWQLPIDSASQALWLTDGSVAIVTGAGIVRVDAKTGAITAARCGWQFGLSAKPHPTTPTVEPVCSALEPSD
jgi:hypothetical protein